MNWLPKLLGHRDREYRGDDFSVRIQPGFRELVSVIHTRSGTTLTLDGERIGRKWEGIDVRIPEDVESERARQIGRDLETGWWPTWVLRSTGPHICPLLADVGPLDSPSVNL